MIHEQHVVLVGDLQVLHEMANNTGRGSKEEQVGVLDPASVDFCVENVTCLGLAQQEALDAHPTGLSHMSCLVARRFLVGIMPSLRLSCKQGQQ